MPDKESDFWENKNHIEQVNELASRIKNNIEDETIESARLIVYYLYDAIVGCEKIHNEILSKKDLNLTHYAIQQLQALAKQFGLDENSLNGALLDALLQSNFNGVAKDNEVKQKKMPNTYETKKTYEMIGILEMSANYSCQIACCEELVSDKKTGDAKDWLDSSLVQRAMETEMFSNSETILKWQLAVNNYIDMRKDEAFKGSPFACAFSVSVASVTYVKGMILKQDRLSDKLLRKYMDGVQPAIWQTILSAPFVFSCCYVGSNGNLVATLANTIGVYAFPSVIKGCGILGCHLSGNLKTAIKNAAYRECQILKEKYTEIEKKIKAKCDGIHCKIPGFKEICGWIYRKRSDPEWIRINLSKQKQNNDKIEIEQNENKNDS